MWGSLSKTYDYNNIDVILAPCNLILQDIGHSTLQPFWGFHVSKSTFNFSTFGILENPMWAPIKNHDKNPDLGSEKTWGACLTITFGKVNAISAVHIFLSIFH